jgi:hypothetical protein
MRPLACLGDTRSLIVSSGMPYTPVRVQGRTGFFVVDLGADISSISPTTFLGGVGPQAGLIGTELLLQHVLTLDYANGLIHRASPQRFCDEATLRRAGFQPLSSRGYFGRDPARLTCPAAPRRGGCPNIPTIPLRIGPVQAVAQVDTGYADTAHPPSLNINRALFDQLKRAGVALRAEPSADLQLSSCVRGESEQVRAFRLPQGAAVELVGSEGQLGASFVNDGTLVVDPLAQRLWFRGPSSRTSSP